jgi:transposase
MVNPRQVRDLARATGRLAKTDWLDARVLAHFAESVQPTPHPLPDVQTQELTALLTRRHQVVEMLTAEKNRLRATRSEAVRQRV